MSKSSLALILLLLAAALALGACGKEDEPSDKVSSQTKQTDQANPEAAAPQNAAVRYNKAFENMKFDQKTHPAAGPVMFIMNQGWDRHGTPELEQALEEDEDCFAEFRSGLDLESCDFTFGKEQFLYRNGDSARTRKIWNMTCLNLVKSRLAEYKGKALEAVEACLDEMKFMRHVAQGTPFVDKVTAFSLEERTLVALRNMLQKESLDEQSRTRLIAGLESLEKDRFPAAAIFEGEKKYYLFIVDETARRIAESRTPETEKDDPTGPFCEKLAAEARRIADHYYGLVSKADASRSEEDWKAVVDEIALMREGGREFRSKVRSTDDLVAHVLSELESKGVDAATKAAQAILGIYSSDARGMTNTHKKIADLIERVKQAAKSGRWE